MAQATLDRMLKSVLSSANKEQNMHYPPYIFETHFNLVTGWLVDECVRLYPSTQSVVDVIRPFLLTQPVNVINGRFALPSEYRNMLRIAVAVTDDFKEDCGCTEDFAVYHNDPLAPSEEKIQAIQQRTKCISHPVRMVDTDEWDGLTTHPYKKPTLKKPIANFFDAGYVRIAPYGVSSVEITFVRKPKQYVYGYRMNPDDTYRFDLGLSVESEWDDTAIQYLLKGLNTLYSMYVKDGEMQNWNMEIKKLGLF